MSNLFSLNWFKVGGVVGTPLAGWYFHSGLQAVGFFVAYFSIGPIIDWLKR